MKLSFNRVIFCTALLVSAAAKAQEVTVVNTTSTTYTVTVFSTDETKTRTFMLIGGEEELSIIPVGSIRRILAENNQTDKPIKLEKPSSGGTIAVPHYSKHRFEIREIAPGESVNHVAAHSFAHLQNSGTRSEPYIVHMAKNN
jgi:hypothetical protein